MAKIENGWFYEFINFYHGQAMSLQVEEVLLQQKSKFQDILIFKSKDHGNVLVLDGVIQVTNKDEFAYQEMLAFLPLNSHPNPKKKKHTKSSTESNPNPTSFSRRFYKLLYNNLEGFKLLRTCTSIDDLVLVIGAGDGGVIREVAKHPSVESIVQCELDEDVVKYCKKYLPKLSCGYASSKHKLHIGCGKEFMKQYKEEFDVIITDSSDCEGPGSALFQKEYFELVSSALKPDGIMCGEGECPWLDSSTIRTVLESCKSFFPVVQYAFANVPTYPCGQIGFFLCSRNKATRFADPVTIFTEEQLFSFNLRYYNSDIHKAAFATPQYFKKFYDDYDGCDEIDNQNWIWQNVERSPGQSFGLVKKEIMLHKRTDRCDVVVFKNSIYGNVLVVDDIMQYTEKDQPLYEESLAHLALNSHPFPKKVLIIGGFSGGIIHEVAKHQAVETVTQIEQSQEIADVAKEYFPRSAAGYNNSKLHEFCVCDYQDFLRRHLQEFDVIITAPDDVFFNTNFSELLKSSLKQGGLCISKATSFWTDLEKIGKQVKRERELFPLVKLAYICIPTFPYGQATFVLRSLNKETNFEMPIRRLEDEQLLQMTFYNADVHAASLVLPEFVRKAVED